MINPTDINKLLSNISIKDGLVVLNRHEKDKLWSHPIEQGVIRQVNAHHAHRRGVRLLALSPYFGDGACRGRGLKSPSPT